MMMVCYQSIKSQMLSSHVFPPVIFVGFVETFTAVNETVGAFELCVAIFTNASLLPDSFQFSLNLITIPDSAGGIIFIQLMHLKG